MNDTPAEFEARLDEHYRRMSPEQRMKIAASMYETARAIVLSSLASDASKRDRRLAYARRMYGGELSQEALIAYAVWDGEPDEIVQQ